MYPVLCETGFANQLMPRIVTTDSKLKDLYITAAVRCAPPITSRCHKNSPIVRPILIAKWMVSRI